MMPFYSRRWHGCRIDEFLWRGHRLIVMENQLLRIGVLASKGADIIEFRYKPQDLDVLWHAPQPYLPPGEEIPTVSRAQGNFLDYYPGVWQEVAPNAGPATSYENAQLGQHGEVALLPWDFRVIEDSEARIEAEFLVETLRTPFRLSRRISLASGSSVLNLEEQMTNLGEQRLPYQWGHHCVFGPPFLEEGCQLIMPPCDVVEPEYSRGLQRRFALNRPGKYPELETVSGAPGRVDLVLPKSARCEDVLLFNKFAQPRCTLRNPYRQIEIRMKWDGTAFPYVWCWQVYGGAWGYPFYGRTYNLAIEPFNCPIEPLENLAQRSAVPFLDAGASAKAQLEIGIGAV
ncbi:MAG: aldose 1-epimerase [Bryobacteraceae bacterium]